MSIPDAAIEAAAEALWEEREELSWCGVCVGGGCVDCRAIRTDYSRAAVEAAMPAIREAIAQEVEALPTTEPVTDKDGAPIDGLSTMIPPSRVKEDVARIVRGGTP